MKIVFLNPVGVLGGAERALLTLLAALRQRVPDWPLVLIVGTPGPLVAAAIALGVEVHCLPLPEALLELGDSGLKQGNRLRKGLQLGGRAIAALPGLVRYQVALYRLLRQLQPDCIHSNGLKTHSLLALLSPVAPIIWHLHDFYGSRPVMAKVLGQGCHRVQLGIAVSQAVAEDAQHTLPGLPIAVVHNGVDTEVFSPIPEQTEVDADRPLRIGLVATFARWKGQDVFLQAIAHLMQQPEPPNLRFYLIGGPIYQTMGSQFALTELQAMAHQWGIAPWVEFLGFQAEMAPRYAWLDAVVHASTQPEPFGLVIAEAMACGRPVIVSQAGGAAELFTPGWDGLAVPPGDAIALAAAMRQLADSPTLRQQLGQQARKTALARFSASVLAERMVQIYAHLPLQRSQ